MSLLKYAADHTSRIRLVTLVLDNDFRHPAVLAKEAATLDLLSGGRLELGLGAGWLVDEYRQTGLPFRDGPTRAAQLEEAVHLMKALFSDTPVSFSGRFYDVHNLDGRPKPVQRPHPPLMIGGSRPRLLRFAAREADIVVSTRVHQIHARGQSTRCAGRPKWCTRRLVCAPPSCTSTRTSGA
jgi:alkanesulfonate monooxygenase SsuD/methylene tetrahydromethanopterin reductase-like flavin-dependent oxidoreductase (luciferase family)